MKKTMTTWAAALVALTWAISLQAHHSDSMYDPTRPIWVQGTVVRLEGIDPHTITTLEERREGGQVRRWAVEGPGESQLDRLGVRLAVPHVGDAIEFCAFPYKSAAELSRIFPGVDFSRLRSLRTDDESLPQSVWGHVMVTPDGGRRLWNQHGILSACMRSSDESRQSWVDFLESSASVRMAWCQQRGYAHVRSTASLSEYVEEINGLINDPCT